MGKVCLPYLSCLFPDLCGISGRQTAEANFITPQSRVGDVRMNENTMRAGGRLRGRKDLDLVLTSFTAVRVPVLTDDGRETDYGTWRKRVSFLFLLLTSLSIRVRLGRGRRSTLAILPQGRISDHQVAAFLPATADPLQPHGRIRIARSYEHAATTTDYFPSFRNQLT